MGKPLAYQRPRIEFLGSPTRLIRRRRGTTPLHVLEGIAFFLIIAWLAVLMLVM